MFNRIVLVSLMLCTLMVGGTSQKVRAADAPVEVRNAAYSHTINNNTWGSVIVGINTQALAQQITGAPSYSMRVASVCRLYSPYGSGGSAYVHTYSSIAGTIRLDHHQKMVCDYDIFTTPVLNTASVVTSASHSVGDSSSVCSVYPAWGTGIHKMSLYFVRSSRIVQWLDFEPTDKMTCKTDITVAGGTYYFNFTYKNK